MKYTWVVVPLQRWGWILMAKSIKELNVDTWDQYFSEFLRRPCICSTTAPDTVAFICFHYIGGGWCHVFVLPPFCSLRPCRRWHPGTSLRSLVHNSHRDELAKTEELLNWPCSIVSYCNKASDGKCLPVCAQLSFSLTVMDETHVTSARLHPCRSHVSALRRPTCEMKHEIKKIYNRGAASALKIPQRRLKGALFVCVEGFCCSLLWLNLKGSQVFF